jgi:pyrroline-5-carboxylate reductase
LVRAGLTALAFGAGVSSAQRAWVEALFGLVGEVHELPEAQLDAFLALTSSGPAFVALVAEGMADGAVAAGLRMLEKAGVRSALLEAVVAAAQRSQELG